MAVNKTYYKTREQWLAIRAELGKKRLGGSEIGSAAGHNPHKSAYALWAEKCGLVEPPNVEDKEAVKLGRDLEQYVADRFAATTGKKVHAENCVFANEAYPHLFATIDRKIAGEASGLECKTANAYRNDAFDGDTFPESYYAQCLQYLAVTGLERWYLAVLVMGVGFRVFGITTREEELEAPRPEWLQSLTYVGPEELASCEKIAAAFMSRVAAKDWPLDELDGSDSTRETILAVSGPAEEKILCLDGTDAGRLIEERNALNAEIRALEASVSERENRLRALLGSAEGAFLEGWRLSYREQTSNRVNAATVWAYFADKEAPDGLYTKSVTRPLKITSLKAKKAA